MGKFSDFLGWIIILLFCSCESADETKIKHDIQVKQMEDAIYYHEMDSLNIRQQEIIKNIELVREIQRELDSFNRK